MKNTWKKAASFAMSLALVAANSAFSLTESSTIVAKAAEADAQVTETTLLNNVSAVQGADESYYDAETQTLHLKGYVRNGGKGTGIILPEGVNAEDIKHLVADEGTVLPVDCSFLMYNLNKVGSVDLKNADSSAVTNMSSMFVPYYDSHDGEYCYASGGISEIDLTGFNTSNVTDMSDMFYNTSVKALDLSSFDTSKVTDMSGMFACMYSIKDLDVSSFDTSNVTDMSCMFDGWWHVSNYVDIRGFDTSNVTDMSYMFYFNSLDVFDLTNFDTSNVTDMSGMFGWGGAEVIDLSSFDTSKVTNMYGMFYMTGPETIYVGPGWTAESVCGGDMFGECYKIVGGAGTVYDPDHIDAEYAHVDGGAEDPGYLTFKAPRRDESYFDAETGTLHLKGYVRNDGKGKGVVLPGGVNRMNVAHIIAEEGTVLPEDCSDFCGRLPYLKSIDLTNADSSNVTDMSGMFINYAGTELDLSGWDTSNVTDMSMMFYGCEHLETVIVGDGWTTRSVELSDMMFLDCDELKGGSGTVFDEKHTDAEYARIDGGKDAPGYFTAVRNDAEEETTDDNAIPEEVMDTINYLYSNINDPTLKSVADSAIRLFNRFFSFR